MYCGVLKLMIVLLFLNHLFPNKHYTRYNFKQLSLLYNRSIKLIFENKTSFVNNYRHLVEVLTYFVVSHRTFNSVRYYRILDVNKSYFFIITN